MIDKRNIIEESIIDFLLRKDRKIIRHCIFLLFFFIFLFSSGIYLQFPENVRVLWFTNVYILFIAMFYINVYCLVPFFLRRKYISYFTLLTSLILVSVLILHLINRYVLHVVTPDTVFFKLRLIYAFLLSITFIMLTTTIKLLQNWIEDKDKIFELEKLTHEMELIELKNQINPHFLFNMLNNVKALIRKEPEEAVNTILKLSEFLRFQLYENKNNKKSLYSEVQFLSNFLELEQKRREHLIVTIKNNIDLETQNKYLIPYNLFTIFIENAVKHSVDIYNNPSYIDITFTINNNELYLECRNSVCPDFIISDTKNRGLGLVNIKRRLKLLYKDSYKLEIQKLEYEYIVLLNIPL